MDLGRFLSITVTGRAFFIGDLHGEADALHQALAEVDFDPDNGDRVVCVGDLIDRGDDSLACLDLLERHWFYTVVGNHEQMLLETLIGNQDMEAIWLKHGGDWFARLPSPLQRQVRQLAMRLLPSLPIAMEVNLPHHNARIGVVHADCSHTDWDEFKIACRSGLSKDDQARCLWSRDTIKDVERGKRPKPISGVRALIMGHTPREQLKLCGNRIWLDTGSGYSHGRLTMLSDQQILQLVT